MRGTRRRVGKGEEVVGGEQGAARARGRDVSNERVAAGFENHGIIRQIKLERLRPFFHSHIPGPMKWIKPCLSSPPLSMVSFNYRLIYDIGPITTTREV